MSDPLADACRSKPQPQHGTTTATHNVFRFLKSRPRRKLGPLSGAMLVLGAHAVHLLAFPLLALLLGTQAAAGDGVQLSGHSHSAMLEPTTTSGLFLRWATDLLAAATVIVAILMCRATARAWRNVRVHPWICMLNTCAAALCIAMIFY
ncbi:hypothetical protein PaecuDRAFT_3660 [Paenibacillus curdlanolyticus YK9]|uniref:Uncharacterized protein n=1 Tax=Paenibacillus curdlanolyticus YK9 TaxID=717606 RepID=E0IDF6_9BACL|nr:hypothetical protein [Paenibacillus curdlanolyticus]EFM09611.1 hypothetical protein PaecuDRAFT_3660 [Paenibacillus curdlanolyticus YK9]